jgi:endonuclease/exonuclease/phosphatase family metal-dependent hydrolase
MATKIFGKIFLTILFLVAFTGCESGASLAANNTQTSSPNKSERKIKKTLTLSVMAYNVENLFDTVKDPNTDYTYLPLSQKKSDPEVQDYCARQKGFYQTLCFTLDWNESTLNTKLNRIKDTIESATADFAGPDILILEEVENLNVLELLREKLQSPDYKGNLLQGADRRGINIAVLTKLPLAGEPRLHTIAFDSGRNGKPFQSRGIYEVPLQLPNGKTLYVFGVHFPSQSNPHTFRRQAALELSRLMKSKPEGYVIAGGDFNTIKEEPENNPRIYEDILASDWFVSHVNACFSCLGTHFFERRDPVTGEFKGGWDFLDVLLFPKSWLNSQPSIRLKQESVQVKNSGIFQSRQEPRTGQRIPARFEPSSPVGVSDHFPIYAEFEVAL